MASYSVKKNVGLLSLCQGLSNVSVTIVISVSALAGYMLAENKGLATLPHALMWSTTMATSPLAAMLFRRVGRRYGFVAGGLIGICGALTAAYGTNAGQFWVFTLGIMLMGAFNSFAMFYRFAAAEAADSAFRAKAIALVIGGGVVAPFVGGAVANHTYDLFPINFVGTFLVLTAVPVLLILTVLFVEFPHRAVASAGAAAARSLMEIARDSRFVVAVLAGTLSWAAMVMVMTATPISMKLCGLQFRPDVTDVIQWHVFAMYAPSFFSGWLISRFGVHNVMLAGLAAILASVAVGVAGTAVAHFWIMNVLIGVGWNFLFVGATDLLSACHTPAERDKVQGVNDFIVFGGTALASFAGGYVMDAFSPDAVAGWDVVNYLNIPAVILVAAAVLWGRTLRRAALAD
jgi:MFS family permease